MAHTAAAAACSQLVDMAMSYHRSRALAAAARLEVADKIGDGNAGIAELAAACHADESALYRLMRALAGLGVVKELEPRRFALTEFGKPLRKDSPQSSWAGVIFWADLLADSWAHLTDCVRTGQGAAALRPEIGARWQQDAEVQSAFRAVMGTSPAQNYLPIARAWDFSRTSVVADLGGGGGALLEAILEISPSTRGLLVDRADSIEAARPRFASGPASGRCDLIAADLTQGVPAGADVYILKHVLHGYSDAQSIDILRHCRAALPPQGRVLIVEFVLPDVIDHADPDLERRLLSDLNMLAVTQGRERSEREWKDLLRAADLLFERTTPVISDLVSIIEATSR
jgi:hypothetical protein